jgi:hypothetical protein
MLYFLVWEIYSADWFSKEGECLPSIRGQDVDSQVLLTKIVPKQTTSAVAGVLLPQSMKKFEA